MPVPNGTRLGPYEIVRPIGAGGMGEVYRATDTRLRRDVAVKILPQSFGDDRGRLTRFEQEARATAALRHSNIVTIHDFATEPYPYLVTELLEGETLAEVLARGRVSPRRAVAWSLQILHGIAAAHARGIIHRDLKPANIFITTDGSVKVLDFGLAKVIEADDALTNAPTARVSEPGMVVGTIGYMSPEQIRGEALDARTDIFSFGVVLYEMLSGRAPFSRASGAETMTAVLRDDPPPLETPPHPKALAATVMRCLEKPAEARFHTAHDLALHLEMLDLGESGSSPSVAFESYAPPHMQQVTFHRGTILDARFAPDGSIVYGASWGERDAEIYVSHRGMPETRPLGIKGSVHSVSRNGELAVSLGRQSELGFISVGTLARVPLVGGAPRTIASDVYEAEWSPDGKQLAIVRRFEHGFRIEYPIGHALYETSAWISHLRFSPSGDRLAFLEHPAAGDNFGFVSTVDLSGHTQRLSGDLYISWGLTWHPKTGEIWYSAAAVNAGQGQDILIYGVTLDGKTREVFSTLGTVFIHDIAPDGTVLMTHEILRRNMVGHIDGVDRDLTWFDWSFPMRLSPDGRLLLFEEQAVASGGQYTFFLRDTDGGPAVRLDQGRGRDLSADGTRVLALTNDTPEKLLMVPTGVGEVKEIPVNGIEHFLNARFLPGEKEIVVVGARAGEDSRMWRVAAGGGDPAALSTAGVTSWFFFGISPDGESIASIGTDQRVLIHAIHGENPPREVKGAERGDFPVHWPSADHLYVCRREEKRTLIFDINLESGERTLVRTIAPPDPAGVRGLFPIHFASDPDNYVVGYRLILSSLFVGTGIR